jgi:cytoskeletal protein CcmA (bactofilin family)
MLRIFKKEAAPPAASNITSLVREGNEYFSDELICLNEKLTGSLFCTEKVVIEHNANLTGNIAAKVCIISGTVNGTIATTDHLEIKSTAVIEGDIRSAIINVESGAIINGSMAITADNDIAEYLANKTKKYTADDFLSARLTTELEELNTANAEVASIVVLKKNAEKPAPVAEMIAPEAPKPLEAAKPLVAATTTIVEPSNVNTEPVKAAEKPLMAAGSNVVNETPDPAVEVIKAAEKPLTAATPKAAAPEENNQRWW